MITEDFFKDYDDGRRDFRGECLQGLDLFTPVIRKSHAELFTHDLSKLVLDSHPIIYKIIEGVDLTDGSLFESKVVDANFLSSILINANLSRIDGRMVNLTNADLSNADLRGADLRFAKLNGIKLVGANLEDAKLDNSKILWGDLKGACLRNVSGVGLILSESKVNEVNMINANFERTDFSQSDLSGSILDKASFKGGNFTHTIAHQVSALKSNFSNANCYYIKANNSIFSESVFKDTNLVNANLVNSVFNYSSFDGANLAHAQLDSCSFCKTSFQNTKFDNTSINNTSLKNVHLGNTIFSRMDLSPFFGMDIYHTNSSFIDTSTIAKTLTSNPMHPLEFSPSSNLQNFLNGAGIPAVVSLYLIDSIRSLQPDQLVNLMRSTFLSYGSPDQDFADKLNKDLVGNGVTTFFFPLDAPFGEKLYSTMRRVEEYDRIILICSKRSLDRTGLQYELEKTLEREARDGGASYLIPIALDDYLFSDWKPKRKSLRDEVLNRVVADFRDMNNYEKQFNRLLTALKKEITYDISPN